MRLTTLTSRKGAVGASAILAVAASVAGLTVAPSANAAVTPVMTLNTNTGPSADASVYITATTTAATFTASGQYVQFVPVSSATDVACPATFTTAAAVSISGTTISGFVTATSTKMLSSTKLVIQPGAGVKVLTGVSAYRYKVCLYNGNTNGSSTLLAAASTTTGSYTVAAKPTISALASNNTSGVWPRSAPALGGGTLTITGTNFTAGTTAKIGTSPLTNINIVSSSVLTGTIPSQAAGTAQNVSVTNTGGTTVSASAFTYKNGIVVTPNTTPTGNAATDLDIVGVGFSTLSFTTTTGAGPDTVGGHVYLVAGTYDAGSGGTKAKAETAECLNVLVVSDGELVCTLNTADNYGQAPSPLVPVADGTYQVVVVGDGRAADSGASPAITVPDYQSVVSSGATFTVADF